MLGVRFVASHADVPEPLWACFAPPLEGRWWYAALEEAGLDDQFSFFYAVIEEEGRPVGMAPLFRMDLDIAVAVPEALHRLLVRWLPRLVIQRTLFVGSPCSDQGHVGLVPGSDRAAVLAALQRALLRKQQDLGAAMLVWKDMPSELDAALATVPGLFRMESFPGALAPLAGGKEGYLAGLKASYRQKLKRRLKLGRTAVELTTEVVQRPDAATLDEIFRLFWQTYEKGTTKFERLNRRFFELIAAEPQAHFLLLKAEGELVAFMLCFDVGDRVINKFIGIDYARPKEWLLYFRLWDAVVDFAVARGASEIQSGQTAYTAKIETGHRLEPMANWCRHRNPVVNWLFRQVARRTGWHTLDADLAAHLAAHPEMAALQLSRTNS